MPEPVVAISWLKWLPSVRTLRLSHDVWMNNRWVEEEYADRMGFPSSEFTWARHIQAGNRLCDALDRGGCYYVNIQHIIHDSYQGIRPDDEKQCHYVIATDMIVQRERTIHCTVGACNGK
jgi:hypothetical protein